MLTFFCILIITTIVAVDQITKLHIMKNLAQGEFISVIKDFFYITYLENKGAAWGILQNKRYVFIVVTIIITVIMFIYLLKTENTFLKLTLSMIIGGATGNLIDRIYKGSVADFLDFYIFSYNFPAFNVADIFIVTGTILLGIYIIFIHKEPLSKEQAA